MRRAWCRTGCPPTSPTSPASPCRNASSRRGGSPTPGRFACPRRAGREPGESFGRTRRDGGGRRRRTPFFPPPLEPDHAGARVAEDAHHGRSGTEPRKTIGISQASVWSHPAIMPDVLTIKTAPSLSRERRCVCCFHPLARTKSLSCICASSLLFRES